MKRSLPTYRRHRHAAFTLIELMVSIAIMLIIVSMTVIVVDFTLESERVRGAARQMQSYLEGARDRAIFANEPRGVRLLLDQQDRNAVTSIVYIGAVETWTEGSIHLERKDVIAPSGEADSGDVDVVVGDSTGWVRLMQRGLLTGNPRIKIPAGENGSWYTVNIKGIFGPDGAPGKEGDDDDGNGIIDYLDINGNGSKEADEPWDLNEVGATGGGDTNELWLTTPYREPANTDVDEVRAFRFGSGPKTYELELPARMLPNEQPSLLGKGVAIDLRSSRLPQSWYNSTTGAFSDRMDILFSPRGTIVGTPASAGVIHLVLAETPDVNFGVPLRPSLWNSGASYIAGNWVAPVDNLGNPIDTGMYYKCVSPSSSASPASPGASPPTWGNFGNGDLIPDGGSVTWQAFQKHENLIVTVFTRTGAISAHPVYPLYDDNAFRYAEVGEVAGK